MLFPTIFSHSGAAPPRILVTVLGKYQLTQSVVPVRWITLLVYRYNRGEYNRGEYGRSAFLVVRSQPVESVTLEYPT